MENGVLTAVEEMTPEWLTQVLRDGGYLQDGVVAEVQLDAHTSVNASNAILKLSYSEEARGDRYQLLLQDLSKIHYSGWEDKLTLVQAKKSVAAMVQLHAICGHRSVCRP